MRRKIGLGYIRNDGYIVHKKNGKNKYEHIRIVEGILRRHLPKGVVVHHIDGDSSNNSLTNLVVCPSQAYHNLIHKRQRAHEICGHADWFKCRYCKQYASYENTVKDGSLKGNARAHRECKNEYSKINLRKNREKKKYGEINVNT